ncbi:MAG: hypothetical protein ACJ8LI_01610, partial [Chthoniobacterales bacterium]
GNVLAMLTGFACVALISNLPNAVAGIFGRVAYTPAPWWPKFEFPWWIFFGTIVTFAVAVCFRSEHAHQPPA